MNFLFRSKPTKSISDRLKDINIQILSSVYLTDKMEGISTLYEYIENNGEDIYKYCFESLKENYSLSYELLYKLFEKNKNLIELFFSEKDNFLKLLATENNPSSLIILLLEYKKDEMVKIEPEYLSIFKNEDYNRYIETIENDDLRRNLVIENFFEYYLKNIKNNIYTISSLLYDHEFNQNYFIELNWPMKINTAYKNNLLSVDEIFYFLSALLNLNNKKLKYFQDKIPRKWFYLAIKHNRYDLIYRFIYNNPVNISHIMNNLDNLKMEESIEYLTFLSYIIKIVGDDNFIFYENLLKEIKKESDFFLKLILIFNYHFQNKYITFDIYSYFENDILANIFLLKERSVDFIILFSLLLTYKKFKISNEQSLFINEFINQLRTEKISRVVLSIFIEKRESNLYTLLNNIPPLPVDVLCSLKGNILYEINFLSEDSFKIIKELRERVNKPQSDEILNKPKEDIFDL